MGSYASTFSNRRARCARPLSYSRQLSLRVQSPWPGLLAVNPNSTWPGGIVRTSSSVDVIRTMKDAKDLPEQSYRAF